VPRGSTARAGSARIKAEAGGGETQMSHDLVHRSKRRRESKVHEGRSDTSGDAGRFTRKYHSDLCSFLRIDHVLGRQVVDEVPSTQYTTYST
jgi:hypothetical protein